MDSSSIAQSVPLSSLTCLFLILQAGIKCFQVRFAYTASHPQAQATFCPVLVLMSTWIVFSVVNMNTLPALQLSCPTYDIRLLSESASTTWAVLVMVAGLLDHTTWASLCFASHLYQWALTAHETVTGSALSLHHFWLIHSTPDWKHLRNTAVTSLSQFGHFQTYSCCFLVFFVIYWYLFDFLLIVLIAWLLPA